MTAPANNFFRLHSLGVPSNIIKQAALPEKMDEPLHQRLKAAMSTHLNVRLLINMPWQLQLLTGRRDNLSDVKEQKDNLNAGISHYAAWGGDIKTLLWIMQNQPQLLTIEDQFNRNIAYYAAWGDHKEVIQWIKENRPLLLTLPNKSRKNIAHYAAWSGRTTVLQWINDNHPELLSAMDVNECTIAHYAAWSGTAESLQWIKENKSELFTEESNNIVTIAKYAAWSGNVLPLQWIKDNYPELLTGIDKHGRNIAHYAAWSGNKEALQWVKDNQPKLLTVKDNESKTIAHYGAWSGNKEMMEWIKKDQPKLLMAQDKHGALFTHYAARSGNKEMLQWVKENYSELLTVEDNNGKNIVFYAAQSSNPEQLNKALILNKTPRIFKGPLPDVTVMTTLKQALDRNYSLTDVELPANITTNRIYQKDVLPKLLRNKEIEKATFAFKIFIRGYFQPASNIFLFNLDLMLEIFKKLFPADIPNKITNNIFNTIMTNLCPETTKHTVCMNLIDLEITNLKKNLIPLLCVYEEKMIKLLSALKKQLMTDKTFFELKNILVTFYLNHEKTIQSKNIINISFFNSNLSVLKMFERLFAVMDIKESDLINGRNDLLVKLP